MENRENSNIRRKIRQRLVSRGYKNVCLYETLRKGIYCIFAEEPLTNTQLEFVMGIEELDRRLKHRDWL